MLIETARGGSGHEPIWEISAKGLYIDAISVNLAPGDGTYTTQGSVGLVNSTPQVGSMGNWMNMIGGNTVYGGDGYARSNFAAQADSSGWHTGFFDQTTPLTATGLGLGSFGVQFYDGGWGRNAYWNNTAETANTLARTGIRNGQMVLNGQPTALTLKVDSVPVAFQTAGYDVFALAGASPDGVGQTWMKLNSVPVTTASYTSASFPDLGIRTMSAFQILERGALVAHLRATPESGSAIGIGGEGLFPGISASTTVTLDNYLGDMGSNISVTAGNVSGADAAFFSVPGFVNPTNLAGGTGAHTWTIQFAGAADARTYQADVTFVNSTGTDVVYHLSATVIPSTWKGYLPGDFNEDGEVGPDDFGILKDNFARDSLACGQHESWAIGDANDDGEIGPDDFGILKDNFARDGGPTYSLTPAPEPTSFLILVSAAASMLMKRRAKA